MKSIEKVGEVRKVMRLPGYVCFWLGCFLGLPGLLQAQASAPVSETYHLRVQNVSFGRIEMSADGGQTFSLVGRVLRATTSATPLKAAKEAGKVSHASREGLAFGVAPGLVLKLRPLRQALSSSASRGAQAKQRPAAEEPGAIWTDIPSGQGIFGSLIPPPGTVAQLLSQSGKSGPIPAGFTPSGSDTFLFQVTRPERETSGSAGTPTLAESIAALSKAYAEGATARAKAAKRKIVSGTLTLRASLPQGEPDPIDAVTFMADGDLMAAQNTPPFSYAWDTRKVPDGEHVVEIRAFNKAGRMITRVRALIVVQNPPPAP